MTSPDASLTEELRLRESYAEVSSEERRVRFEKYGYFPEVITFLGFGTLKGVGFQTLRNIGGPQGLLPILSQTDDQGIVDALHAQGVKSLGSGFEAEGKDSFRKIVWRNGLELAWKLTEARVHFIQRGHADYPESLWDLPEKDQPLWLFVGGNKDLLSTRAVAIVGTRKPSEVGEFLTRYAVAIAGEFDVPVISGLAYGIDTLAHEFALALDLPTISVLGSGIFSPYPSKNLHLADRIVRWGGALVSEYMPYAQPSADSFVFRNRIQAALARCVVATQWRRSSGTAHTVRYAHEMRRANISLSLNRCEPYREAGQCDIHLALPVEHQRFLDELGAALQDVQGTKLTLRQQALF